MRIEEAISNLRTKAEGVGAGVAAAWDAFKGNTGMIPKEEQTIGNLKYAIRMNQEEMEPNEINFVDFNGMVLSMTIEEVMQLTEMPKPNEYYNLTFEHWTKTLEEIQDGRCHTVGATYHTTDGFNYYVVETTQDGEEVEIGLRNHTQNHPENLVYWGDGTYDIAQYSQKHVYEKKGRYAICFKDIAKYSTWWGGGNSAKWLKEVYLNVRVDRSGICIRTFRKLEKLCMPDNGTSVLLGHYNFDEIVMIQSLICGNSYAESRDINYFNELPRLKYFVADGHTGKVSMSNFINLACFSLKNISKVTGTGDLIMLRDVVFDSVVSIANAFPNTLYPSAVYSGFRIVDLPETLASISNKCFLKNAKVYIIRSLTPPTLGGTNVFWYNGNGNYRPVIHIRKDATYTDAAGTTYTGLEAYAHATNWATLYANTNYTFIDDL